MEKTYEIHFIKDQSPTKNNVYLVVDKESKKTAIIDPACSMEQINEIVTKFDIIIDAILVTHTHFDHIRRINDLVKKYDCKVYVSRIEALYYSYSCKNLHLFEDKDLIHLGDTLIECLLTPGHTMGSSCFLLENSLFSGDTIFIEGCGLCTSIGGSAVSMFHSIAKIKQLVDDSVLVYPGHTYNTLPGKSLSYLKNNNIYFVIEEEKKFVAFRMRKNQNKLFDFI
jgi:hydroxyacylglutathione hydrolase